MGRRCSAETNRYNAVMQMRIHVQRKRVLSMEPSEIERLDLSAYSGAADVQVALLPEEDGIWLTIIQETPVPLNQIPLLPGFRRVWLRPARKPTRLLN